jgi:hypothetical protein
MADTLTHISGDTFHIGGRTIQRCGICGAKLCDNLNAAAPLNADGSEPTFPTWPAGRLVQVEAGNPTRYSLLEETEKVPDDICLDFA